MTKHLLYLLPLPSVSFQHRHNVLELARFLNELSVIDYFFVPHRPSHVALAAVANAMEELSSVVSSDEDSQEERDSVELLSALNLNLEDPAVLECRHRLRLLYAQGGYAAPRQSASVRTSANGQRQRPSSTPSPVCVSYGTTNYRPEYAENKDEIESS